MSKGKTRERNYGLIFSSSTILSLELSKKINSIPLLQFFTRHHTINLRRLVSWDIRDKMKIGYVNNQLTLQWQAVDYC